MNHRLMQLLRDNARCAWRAFRAEATDAGATVYLYDVIDPMFGVGAAQFNAELAKLAGRPVTLRINSPGGDVFDARAMATAIREHGQVTAVIDGLAASAATYVATAANDTYIADGAFFMVHRAWTMAMGNAEDLIDTAALLEKVDASLVADYAKKTGQPERQIAAWMAAETWFSAQEAVDAGFVDGLVDVSGQPAARWNVGAFANAPAALLAHAETEAPAQLSQDEWMQRQHELLRLYEIG